MRITIDLLLNTTVTICKFALKKAKHLHRLGMYQELQDLPLTTGIGAYIRIHCGIPWGIIILELHYTELRFPLGEYILVRGLMVACCTLRYREGVINCPDARSR